MKIRRKKKRREEMSQKLGKNEQKKKEDNIYKHISELDVVSKSLNYVKRLSS